MSANKRTKPGKQPPYAPVVCYIAKYLSRPLRRLTERMDREHACVFLRGILFKVMADKEGRPGRIDVLSGNLRLLHGFEFNRINTVAQPFVQKCRSWVDEENRGVMDLPRINPAKDIVAPPGAQYYRLFAFMIGMHHKKCIYQVKLVDALGFHALDSRLTCGARWVMQKNFSGKALLVTGFGIRFYDKQVQEIMVKEYEYDNDGGRRPAVNTIASSLVIHKALPW